jgi:hypothetical protein
VDAAAGAATLLTRPVPKSGTSFLGSVRSLLMMNHRKVESDESLRAKCNLCPIVKPYAYCISKVRTPSAKNDVDALVASLTCLTAPGTIEGQTGQLVMAKCYAW